MPELYQLYRHAQHTIPVKTWGWNIYGAGIENFGRGGNPEQLPVPEPGDDQLLVRIDSVGMCFSDVKIIKQGGKHPKLYNRDLTVDPTRLGHEVALTVMKAGKNLEGQYHTGQRLAVQPDIYQDGKSTAYGYTVPGGLIQYHLIGAEVLKTDEGACLLPLEERMGYAESSLLEPWGCVAASYTQRRRLEPKPGGVMLILGEAGDETAYSFSSGLEAPGTILLLDAPASIRALTAKTGAQVVERKGILTEGNAANELAALSAEFTGGRGFDDIVMLNTRSARLVSEVARHIARRGTLNLVSRVPLDGLVEADLGRLHYDYIAFVGNPGADIARSYGETRNRCELRPGGNAVFVGAGGPMGQMHVQRAIEHPYGPRVVIATEVNDDRLQTIKDSFTPLADKHGRKLYVFNPANAQESMFDFVMRVTEGEGADDVVVSVPVAALMSESAALMNPDGMLVLFAGVPNGTFGALNLSNVYLHNAQYTGTSGLTLNDQASVMQRALEGSLSPGRSVAAIGGFEAAREAMVAVMESRYPGKIVIFPQIHGVPLLGLDELAEKLPDVAEKLNPDGTWTLEAERVLIDHYWKPPA